jgi:nitrite reductase (cytochrome c-552)
MSQPTDNPAAPPRRYTRSILKLAAVAALSAVAAAGASALLINIFEKKQEARSPFFRVVELTDATVDPAVWGRNFPLQYDGYRRTTDMARTRFGGSEAEPRTPTAADPRSIVARSRLEEDPRLKRMWAGYAFAVDFREERGHAYMLEDQTFTERQRVTKQPGACLQCHASVYAAYMELGGGDLFAGFEEMNKMPYAEARALVEHPISCVDCHDPETMRLRITRPAFIEGMRALKASEGVEGYDVNEMASRQEMRSFVCGQCHVEYYFQGEGKRLVYPWPKGLAIEGILSYYDEVGHKDFAHAETGAPVLKAQHPEFELSRQGIHARAGVACADCHMPYTREGALKISDHHIRSPLLSVDRSCQPCHRAPEAELVARVEAIQEKTFEIRGLALDALLELVDDIKAAKSAGAADGELAAARDFQRRAQFFLDFVEAENSMGFHAPEEALRILAKSLDFSRQGARSLPRGAPASQAALPAAP